MANIMITDICNLNCCYCFANEFVNNDEISHISIDSFEKILDFIETAKGEEQVGLIGGEPTLHPEFNRLLEILNKRDKIRDVVIFTNGICIDRYFEQLLNSKIHLLINCNSPKIIGEYSYICIKENIRTLIEKYNMKNRITLGLNIYSAEMDYSYILDLIDEFSMDHLRLSVVVPNSTDCTESLEYFSNMKEITFSIICDVLRHNAMPYFDCNKIPVCILSEEEREELLDLSGDMSISNVISEYSNCSPVLDILQNETCVRCFGLSDYLKVDINGFETIDDLRGFFTGQIDVYAHSTYVSEKCKDCYERVCRKCSGGCLVYKIGEIERVTNLCNKKGD